MKYQPIVPLHHIVTQLHININIRRIEYGLDKIGARNEISWEHAVEWARWETTDPKFG